MQGMISLFCLLEGVLHGNLGWIQEKDLSAQCVRVSGVLAAEAQKCSSNATCICLWEFPKDVEVSRCPPRFHSWQEPGCPAPGAFLQPFLGGFLSLSSGGARSSGIRCVEWSFKLRLYLPLIEELLSICLATRLFDELKM